jgi:hypothetical protein
MVLLILSPDEMLEKGLRYANLHNSNVSRRKKIERFGSWFGSSPAVLSQIWEDLQTVLDGGIETHDGKGQAKERTMVVVLTADETRRNGLDLVGFDYGRRRKTLSARVVYLQRPEFADLSYCTFETAARSTTSDYRQKQDRYF